jgi:hypothetical protein
MGHFNNVLFTCFFNSLKNTCRPCKGWFVRVSYRAVGKKFLSKNKNQSIKKWIFFPLNIRRIEKENLGKDLHGYTIENQRRCENRKQCFLIAGWCRRQAILDSSWQQIR